jgi:hypothetical protein
MWQKGFTMPARKEPKLIMNKEELKAWSNKKFGGKIGVTERGDAGVHIKEVLEVMPDYSGAILITKNPGLILPHIETMDKMHPYGNNKGYIIHCTITGYGGTALEPRVPKPAEAIYAYNKLVSKLGGQRVVLRVDPIIPTDKGLEVAYDIIRQARGRVRISFFDAYRHALARMSDGMQAKLRTVYKGTNFHAPLELRLAAFNTIKDIMPVQTKLIEVCGEPGIPCTGCVSKYDLQVMGIEGDFDGRKGQRPACSCIVSKQEMLDHKGQCKHGCLYCYWR